MKRESKVSRVGLDHTSKLKTPLENFGAALRDIANDLTDAQGELLAYIAANDSARVSSRKLHTPDSDINELRRKGLVHCLSDPGVYVTYDGSTYPPRPYAAVGRTPDNCDPRVRLTVEGQIAAAACLLFKHIPSY